MRVSQRLRMLPAGLSCIGDPDAARACGVGGMARRLRGCGLVALLMVPGTAWADPWIPTAGTGTAKPMIRLSGADRAFPASGFTTTSQPSSAATQTQLRITGVHGLGYGFSLEYDFRGAFLHNSKRKGKNDIVTNSSGLQDQKLGLNYGLIQTPSFANSVTFNIVIPTGSNSRSPALGSGQWAVEPDYQMGVTFAGGRGFSTLQIGPRVFTDGVATQVRTYLNVGYKPIDRLTLVGSAFYVRTIVNRTRVPVNDTGELYNLLRFGVTAEYQATKRLRPFVAFETNVAGKGIHASQRLTIGLAIRY